jgi:general secretion pathway protein D
LVGNNVKMRRRIVSITLIIFSSTFVGCSGLEDINVLESWNGVITQGMPSSGESNEISPSTEVQPYVSDSALLDNSSRSLDRVSVSPDAESTSDMTLGSGEFVKDTKESHIEAQIEEGGIKLNFQDADLLEVTKVLLGDILKVNYVVDPQVRGVVTMQTSDALSKNDILPTLELLLRVNKAALVRDDKVYRIVPVGKALVGAKSPQLGDSTLPMPRGFGIQIIPLQYVAANEMAKILGSIMNGEKDLLRVDSKRNLLIMAGSSSDMERYIEMVRMFDIDYMAGASFALFEPDFVSAKILADELEQLLNDPEEGLSPGMIRFLVIERLNTIIAITSRPVYLKQVARWVKRLDRDSGNMGNRLFIYRVQNGKATVIAELLNELFEKSGTASKLNTEANVAPGLKPKTISSQDAAVGENKGTAVVSPKTSADGLAIDANSDIKIIADETNNALMIYTNAQMYRQLKEALKQLDVVPLQVLIEVMVVEVTLNDELKYGVEWFFKNRGRGEGTLDLGTTGLSAVTPGFSYVVKGADDAIRGVLHALSTESDLSILSSPSLLVLNNQEAKIQVGQEVPVSTQQQQSTTANSNIINSVEYRKTGVNLTVKPRVNAGGLVIMEVEQEVSNVPNDQDSNDTLTPRIQQRLVNSTVAVHSDDTVILGGLIKGEKTVSKDGVPGLVEIPVVGGLLFGASSNAEVRTELLVLITPRVIKNRNEALAITEEFRRQLHTLKP